MRTRFIYILIIVISKATSQWPRSFQQSWPTHPPQTGQHQQWNNPYWNNPHQQWNPNTRAFHPVAPVTTTVIVPTTEPPDNPPVMVVQASLPSTQWQNPGWFPPANQFQNGWGQPAGQMHQPTTGLNRPIQIQRQHTRQTLPNPQQVTQWGHRHQQQSQWQQPRPRHKSLWDTSNHQTWYQTTQQTPVHRRPSWPQQGQQPNRQHRKSQGIQIRNGNNQNPHFNWQPPNHQRPTVVQRGQPQQHRQPPSQQRQPPPQSHHVQPQRSHMNVDQNHHQRLPDTQTYHETNVVHQNDQPHGNPQHYNPHEYRGTTTQTPYIEQNALQSPRSTTTTHPDIPPERDYYIQSQLGPPETVTSDPSVRVHKSLTNDALNHPPVWPVDPYEHKTTTATYHHNAAQHPGQDPRYDPSSKKKSQTEHYKEQHNHQPHQPYNQEPSKTHAITATSAPVHPPQDIGQPLPAQSLQDTGSQLPPDRQHKRTPLFRYRTNEKKSPHSHGQQDDIRPPLSAYPPHDVELQPTHHQHDRRPPLPANSPHDVASQPTHQQHATRPPFPTYPPHGVGSQPTHQQHDTRPPMPAHPPHDVGSQPTHQQDDMGPPMLVHPPHDVGSQPTHQQHYMEPPMPAHPPHDVSSHPTHQQHDTRPPMPAHSPHDVGSHPTHQQDDMGPPMPADPPHDVGSQPTHQQHDMGPPMPAHPPHDVRPHPTYQQHTMRPPLPIHPPHDVRPQPTYQQNTMRPPLPTHPPHDAGSKPTHHQHAIRPSFPNHPPHIVGSQPTHQQHNIGPPLPIHPPQSTASQFSPHHQYETGPPLQAHPSHDIGQPLPPQLSHELGAPLPTQTPHDTRSLFGLPPQPQIQPGASIQHQTIAPIQSKQVKTDVIVTPSRLKYGVTHPDGSVTEEAYTLVASRVQRIVSYTTDFLRLMTSYILFDRNRRTFGMRSKRIRDICYAGMLDKDLVDSYKVVVNKTKQVVYPHIEGVSKVFFYKEEEQILFSDVLREAGHYVAGSCGRDPFIFRISRLKNPDIHVGNKLIPGQACPFGPPYRQDYYSVVRCINAACPQGYSCNTHYDVCCPDMPVSTNCYSFSIGQICVMYTPGRRIVD
ncbi:uncharacterized protein LOC127729779 [Mytilus californianus]|uniref:uncharacterized protein LOC127729779 n=1 Tax=Mytilus californianus TaxID=6549 RepID=UPI0022454DE2|nr:uncharacterized protein LOC127729779 [Mytilus californianus]